MCSCMARRDRERCKSSKKRVTYLTCLFSAQRTCSMDMHLRTKPCSLVHFAKPPTPPARRIRTHAQQDVKDKPAEAGNAAFRWNPAQQRWEKKEGALAEGADMWVKPLVGSPYLVWPLIHKTLVDRGLKSIPPAEARQLQEQGKAVLVDVRVESNFNYEHAKDAVNVGLFRQVQGKSFLENVKRFAMGSLAMEATERNDDFRQDALNQLPKDKAIIVYCGLGGTIQTGTKPVKLSGKSYKDDPDRQFGRETRSLKACFELFEAGFTNVLHLEGGINQWRHDGFPVEATQ